MNIREADEKELSDIFMLGFDTWAENLSKDKYISSCYSSEKYKRGSWRVLVENEKIISALIVYRFNDKDYGIGSLATMSNVRGNGYASKLLKGVIKELSVVAKKVFLYSDIDTLFYKKFGFNEVSPDYQKYKNSICMELDFSDEEGSETYFIPDYF